MNAHRASMTASASVAVRRVLIDDDRDVRVVAAFPCAVYLSVGDAVPGRPAIVAVVSSDGVAHPNAVVTSVGSGLRPFAGLRAGRSGLIGGGRVVLAGRSIVVRRWWDPAPALRHTTATSLCTTTRRVAAVAHDHAPALPGDLASITRHLVDAVRSGDDEARARARTLLGRGPGLTPAGDDVLAGLVAGVSCLAAALPAPGTTALRHQVGRLGRAIAAEAVDRTTPVSAALLHHAADGEVAAPAAALLRALTGHGDPAIATRGLLAVGATSGRDLTAGIVHAARLVLARASADLDGPRAFTTGAVRPSRRSRGVA